MTSPSHAVPFVCQDSCQDCRVTWPCMLKQNRTHRLPGRPDELVEASPIILQPPEEPLGGRVGRWVGLGHVSARRHHLRLRLSRLISHLVGCAGSASGETVPTCPALGATGQPEKGQRSSRQPAGRRRFFTRKRTAPRETLAKRPTPPFLTRDPSQRALAIQGPKYWRLRFYLHPGKKIQCSFQPLGGGGARKASSRRRGCPKVVGRRNRKNL
jgi:hypothetical protein